MPMEKQNKLVDLSVDFAVQILNLVKFLKSRHETSYWLLLLSETDYIVPAKYDRLESLCRELRITMISSINTAQGNIK